MKNFLDEYPQNWENDEYTKLRDLLVYLTGREGETLLKEIAEYAGITPGTFPEGADTLRRKCTELIKEMGLQGKLRKLVEVAASQETIYQQQFKDMLTRPPREEFFISSQEENSRTKAVEIKDLEDSDEGKMDAKKLEDILEGQANRAPFQLGVKGYLRAKINSTDWPRNWKSSRISSLTGDATFDSQELINYAIHQGIIPGKQITTLGSLLQSLLDDLGGNDLNEVNNIIEKYNLV